MIRFLGVLVGSSLAVAALIMLIGVPRVQTESRHAPIGDNGVIRLAEPPAAVEPVATAKSEPASASVSAAAEAPPAVAATEAPAQSDAKPEESTLVDGTAAADVLPQWHAFWSPFRTEIAADGFVTQLERVTGLDYRVVKVETGVYEVAFAYGDDDEIIENMAQISAATGLQLPAD